MKFLVYPELPTAALRSSQATLADVDNSAPLAIRPEATYKSGKVVQTNGATSPAVHQHEVKLQGVLHASMDHLAHHFIFGLLAFEFDLARHQVALERLLHQLESHRNGPAVAVVQRVKQIDFLDRATAAMVVVPTNQVTLVRPHLFLDRVIKNQHAFGGLHLPHHRFNLPLQVHGRVVLPG